jgi:hypothetical protein
VVGQLHGDLSVSFFGGDCEQDLIQSSRLKDIATDLTYLFNDTGHWFPFLNLNFFLQSLWDADERSRIQPSFVLAGLAMATLMKSSETELASSGRNRALWLRDAAQAALESAWNSDWIDATLAEAALILALFESSAHPQHNPDRVASSLVFLDTIIQSLALTSIDADDPDVSLFTSHNVPIVSTNNASEESLHSHDRKCSCIPADAAHPRDPFTSWSYPLPWDSSWSAVEIRDEECRRLCWSALSIVASYTAQCAAFNREPPTLFLSNPRNVRRFLIISPDVLDKFVL